MHHSNDPATEHKDLNAYNTSTDAPIAGAAAKPDGEKLQKVLARLGLGSRRALEEIIKSGRVSINQAPAKLGDRVMPSDEIRIDGRKVRRTSDREKRRRVIAYYKPEGEICAAKDNEGRPSVFERLPPLTHDRWVMVGRLDINSSGLLLFTNDGELAHRLMHPSFEIEREYAVRVLGEVTAEMAQILTTGVQLEDGLARFLSIRAGGGEGVNKWYHVILKEGKKREVRRLFESQGLKVSRLLRVKYGAYALPSTLKTGRFIELERSEIGALIAQVGLRGSSEMGATEKTKEKQQRIAAKPMRARRENDKRSFQSNGKSKGGSHNNRSQKSQAKFNGNNKLNDKNKSKISSGKPKNRRGAADLTGQKFR